MKHNHFEAIAQGTPLPPLFAAVALLTLADAATPLAIEDTPGHDPDMPGEAQADGGTPAPFALLGGVTPMYELPFVFVVASLVAGVAINYDKFTHAELLEVCFVLCRNARSTGGAKSVISCTSCSSCGIWQKLLTWEEPRLIRTTTGRFWLLCQAMWIVQQCSLASMLELKFLKNKCGTRKS
jgi:hypothetical protein